MGESISTRGSRYLLNSPRTLFSGVWNDCVTVAAAANAENAELVVLVLVLVILGACELDTPFVAVAGGPVGAGVRGNRIGFGGVIGVVFGPEPRRPVDTAPLSLGVPKRRFGCIDWLVLWFTLPLFSLLGVPADQKTGLCVFRMFFGDGKLQFVQKTWHDHGTKYSKEIVTYRSISAAEKLSMAVFQA